MDFYTSVCLHPKHPHIAPMHAIDWDHLADKQSIVCDAVIEACDAFGLKEIMVFRYNWNVEIIAQFHASFYYSKRDSAIHWTTSGIYFAVDYITFSRLLGLGSRDLERDQIHNERKLSNYELKDLYRRPQKADGETQGLKSFFYVLNNLLRATLTPKSGDATSIHAFAKNVLLRFAENGRPFCIMNFLWEELIAAEYDSRRGFSYAPYIMYVIEKVTGIFFRKDGEHLLYKLTRTKQTGASKTPSASSDQSPPPVDSPPRRPHGPSCSSGPSHSRAPSQSRGEKPNLARRVLKAVFCMCRQHSHDVYEIRKDMNLVKAKLELPTEDIGDPPAYEDPFSAHDAVMAAWMAAEEGGEEEEEEEIAPVRPSRHSSRPSHPHGKSIVEEEEAVQEEEETEEEEYVSEQNDDDGDDDGNGSDDEIEAED